ncbi:N-acetylmuramoyl-L-alanine amidase [Cyanobium sp. NIES-981]|uniref:N-acetylmuramoyl-L-alanine amidase n=1 Tax=Cyanobium sp. NIES-981 TaxID=1851505 RepID=UPI0007DD40AE|nr:peptidoglycan recognition family protein [Cyanobium sp. NIES-981]SBO42210.1 N-acetylmuramoyl-L-alanine amidase, family 2 [Cyanobium sp. NIES-981]
MNLRQQPLVLAGVAAAGMVLLGVIGWISRGLADAEAGSSGQASLLELLEEVRQPPMAPEPGRRQAPGPPPATRWTSPMQSPRCVATADGAEGQRLRALVDQLHSAPLRVRIHPTNYGTRFSRDAFGNPLDPTPRVVVLHETVYGIGSAINTFLTPHPRDEDQVSYHAVIGLDGKTVLLLEPEQRAFGAGNSAFRGQWVVTNPEVGGSVNNFALHVSLETPLDGEDDGPSHSGYTPEQYDALAALLADWMERYPIPPDHITTHRAVDLGGERSDPRSFDWRALQTRLESLGAMC